MKINYGNIFNVSSWQLCSETENFDYHYGIWMVQFTILIYFACQGNPWNSARHRTFVQLKKSKIILVWQNHWFMGFSNSIHIKYNLHTQHAIFILPWFFVAFSLTTVVWLIYFKKKWSLFYYKNLSWDLIF